MPGFDAGAHEPGSIGVVFAEIAAVGIIVGVLQRYQAVMVEKTVSRLKGLRQHDGLGMTTGARRVVLFLREIAAAACELKILWNGSLRRSFTNAHMFFGGSVTGFAVDARFFPPGMVGIRFQVIVGGNLAHVASVAGRIEGILPVFPVDRLVRVIRKMPDAALGRVEPLVCVDIIGQGQGLKFSAVKCCQKIVDVLSSKHMIHPVFLFPMGSPFDYPSAFAFHIRNISEFSD